MRRSLLTAFVLLGAAAFGAGQTTGPTPDPQATRLKIEAQLATQNYLDLIQSWANQLGVDPNLVIAVIKVESDGDPNCQSSAGAMGLMQLMPETCQDLGVSNPFDPNENVKAGTTLLAVHLARYSNDLKKTLAAYNAGPGRVGNGAWLNIPETRHYVEKVLAYYNALRGDTTPTETVPLPATPATPIPAAPAGPVVNSMDLMFEIVQASIIDSEPLGVAEDGTLDNVASKLLDACLSPHAKLDKIAAKGSRLVAQSSFKASEAHAYCFTTPNMAGFASAWVKSTPVLGRFVGLAHSTTADGEVWVVVMASKPG